MLGSLQFAWKSWTWRCPGVVEVRRRRCRRGVEMEGGIWSMIEVEGARVFCCKVGVFVLWFGVVYYTVGMARLVERDVGW
jgi:hypothetical protein